MRRLSLRRRVLFSLVPLLALLLLAELVDRCLKDPTYFGSFRVRRLQVERCGYPAERHPVLGYTLKPGAFVERAFGNERVTVDADGMRSNGPKPRPAGRGIVATGDSFTFGSQVDDEQTWPAQLEQLVQRPVWNGGVFGYSLGQAVLKGELMLDRFPADWLVVSFIDDDLYRCELQYSYTPLPWFEPKDGVLILHPPALEGATTDARTLRSFKDTIGYSALADTVLSHVAPEWWCSNIYQHRGLPAGAGAEVGRLIVERIAQDARGHGASLLVVLQGERSSPASAAVLERVRALGGHTLDLVAEYQAKLVQDPSLATRWFAGHMVAEGNAWVAQRIEAVLTGAEQAGDPHTLPSHH